MSSIKKPLHMSLTVQSAVALGALIILKAVLPVYTGYEIPDELFESICGLLGVSLTVGMRRALPIVILCVMPFGLTHCGPSLCDKTVIEITDHPSLKSPPAGVVKVKCCVDGECKDKAVINSKEVKK